MREKERKKRKRKGGRKREFIAYLQTYTFFFTKPFKINFRHDDISHLHISPKIWNILFYNLLWDELYPLKCVCVNPKTQYLRI